MKPTPDYSPLTSDVFIWHDYNPECKVECSSCAVRTPEGYVLIDPIRLEEQALERLVGQDKIAAVLLTNGNHERGTSYEKERLDVPVYAPEGSRDEVQADRWVKDGEVLFSTIKAVSLPGGGAGETAYLAHGVLILGDALTNLGSLDILPDKYCTNSRLLRSSLQVLPTLDFHAACFAHGLPLRENAKEKIASLVGSLEVVVR